MQQDDKRQGNIESIDKRRIQTGFSPPPQNSVLKPATPACRSLSFLPLDSLNLTSYNMTMTTETRRSALGLIVLSMLGEEPMHPYRMQKLIRQRGKDLVVNVRQRASIYQTIDRLLRLGLIRIHETVSTESRPDRVVYAITDQGRAAARTWLREMLSTVGGDFPEFPAAVSVLMI